MSEKKYTVAETGPKISSFLRNILDLAGFELKFEVREGRSLNPEIENPELSVQFSGPDVDLLLTNKAELLLALEQVTMEHLRVPSDAHSLISFDANDYRALRIEELRISASAAAEKVKGTGVPFRFNSMNSRERRVLHLALRNETELRSESAGAGGYRHVVIYPAGMASLPDPPPPPRRFDGPRSDGPRFGGPRDGNRTGGFGRSGDRGRSGPGGARGRGPGGPGRGGDRGRRP